MTEEKKIKINFAPGCFDHFEGTQEELDELMGEIKDLFAHLTPEELESRSQPVDIDRLLEDESLSDDEFEHIVNAIVGNEKRNLQ
jgi:hypothetical protein